MLTVLSMQTSPLPAAAPAATWRRAGPGRLPGPDPEPGGLATPSDGEFLARFGDMIDDRVAEVIDEMLAERAGPRRRTRLRPALAAAALSLGALASVMLRHDMAAACTVWPSAAVIYLAATRLGEAGRP